MGSRRDCSRFIGYRFCHDALTDSYNRLYFEDELKDKTDPAGVVVMDLDDFKLINDTYGHQAGDMALRTCVSRCSVCAGHSSAPARKTGDSAAAASLCAAWTAASIRAVS